MQKVLIIEDDPCIREVLTYALKVESYAVVSALDGPQGVERFEQEKPDAVLLDLQLPMLSGLDVLRSLRSRSRVPILIVSVKDTEADIVSALELGADDYVTKPYSSKELLARLRAHLRKTGRELELCRLGELEVNWRRAEVFRAGVRIFLTAREFELLKALHDHRAQVLSRDWLLEHVWGYPQEGDERVVDATIKRLRRKVGVDIVETVRGLGYRLANGLA